MKNSEGMPGFNVPVNIVSSKELQSALLQSLRKIFLEIPVGQLYESTEILVANGIVLIDHLEKLLEKDGEFYEFQRQEILSLTKKIERYERA